MRWKGKLIGLLLGLLTRRPQLIVLGLLLGHLYDVGVFSARPASPAPPDVPTAVDPYALLGIGATASDDEVEQAYRRRMSDYHPDRVANAADEIRDLAGVRAQETNAAYEEIKRLRSI
ncbi:MAG: DnaJ domain-containing protein [Arenimonas sp.]